MECTNVDQYFLQKIDQGEAINICLMAHNTEWNDFIRMNDDKKNNVNVQIHGRDYYALSLNGYDLIVFYDDEFYDDSILDDLTDIAQENAIKYTKRVTIGYQSFASFEERKDNLSMKAVVRTIDNYGNLTNEEIIFLSTKSTAISLTSICFLYNTNCKSRILNKIIK